MAKKKGEGENPDEALAKSEVAETVTPEPESKVDQVVVPKAEPDDLQGDISTRLEEVAPPTETAPLLAEQRKAAIEEAAQPELTPTGRVKRTYKKRQPSASKLEGIPAQTATIDATKNACIQSANLATGMIVGISQNLFGMKFDPNKDEKDLAVYQFCEKSTQDYFLANNWGDLTPGWAFAFAWSQFAIYLYQKPENTEKVQGWFSRTKERLKLWYQKRKVAKQEKQAGK